jgi:hypothetical protein
MFYITIRLRHAEGSKSESLRADYTLNNEYINVIALHVMTKGCKRGRKEGKKEGKRGRGRKYVVSIYAVVYMYE